MAEDRFDMEDFTDLEMGAVSEETKGLKPFCPEAISGSSSDSLPC